MQDRYVGDVGDFVKLALLRAVAGQQRLGVAWWRHPDESHDGSGRIVGYLQKPQEWRPRDAVLFDTLDRIVGSGDRRIGALEEAGLLPEARYFGESILVPGSRAAREAHRRGWMERLQAAMADREVLFLDPDNGLETQGFDPGTRQAAKSVSVAELQILAQGGRALIVYHHHTRRAGGHAQELVYWAERLRQSGFDTVDAIRSRPYSPRAFFLLNAPPAMRQRAEAMAMAWQGALSWHPDSAGLAANAEAEVQAAVAPPPKPKLGWLRSALARLLSSRR